jgi:hypothetical protein
VISRPTIQKGGFAFRREERAMRTMTVQQEQQETGASLEEIVDRRSQEIREDYEKMMRSDNRFEENLLLCISGFVSLRMYQLGRLAQSRQIDIRYSKWYVWSRENNRHAYANFEIEGLEQYKFAEFDNGTPIMASFDDFKLHNTTSLLDISKDFALFCKVIGYMRRDYIVKSGHIKCKKCGKIDYCEDGKLCRECNELRLAQEQECRSLNAAGFVYVVEAVNMGFYKIGKTNNVRQRMSGIKMPFDCRLVHTISSNSPLLTEKHLHKRFADKRVNGEWFKLDAADLAYLCGLSEIVEDTGFLFSP